MDSLTYHYNAGNNRLEHIDDAQSNASAYAGDLEDQAPANYDYDETGNLIKDVRDSISNVLWTNAQKLGLIYKTDRTITFRYDAMQHRVAKYVKPNGSTSEKRTYYIRDAQGNVLSTYSAWVKNVSGVITWDSVRLSEQHLYGSTRLGMVLPDIRLYPGTLKNPNLPDTGRYAILEGWKRYELTNHLGNVLAVITDRKRGAGVSDIAWYDADVVSAQQYYPFGMLMPDTTNAGLRRQYTLGSNDYRYGFNGKEGDDEVKGDDNQQDYGMRIYDPRVGRFLSVDPIAREYPWNSTYAFAENDVIGNIDLDGEEKKPAQYQYYKDVYDSYLRIMKSGGVAIFGLKRLESKIDEYEYNSSKNFNYAQISVLIDYYKENVIKKKKDRDDCITTLCNATNRMLSLVGDKAINPNVNSIHDVAKNMQGKDLLGNSIEVDFDESDGKFEMNGSLGQKVSDAIKDEEGYHVFYMSLAYGYHSMLVIVDNTGADKNFPKFYFGDQGTLIPKGWSDNDTQNVSFEFDKFVKQSNSALMNDARRWAESIGKKYGKNTVTLWEVKRPEKK